MPSELRAAALGVPLEGVALAGALAGGEGAAQRWLQDTRHIAPTITGDDLIAAGIPEGPEVGRRLEAVLELRLDGRLARRARGRVAGGAGPGDARGKWRGRAGVSAAELSFDLPGGGHVLFTTRAQGNLSSVGGEDAEHGLQARERLRRQVGVERLQRGYQVHGTTVQRVQADPQRAQVGAGGRRSMETGVQPDTAFLIDTGAQPDVEADGQATILRGVGAMVLTADCLPVALGCGGAVAIVHAGWRGLAAGVLEEGVRAIEELGGADEIVAIIGPGAGPCCYEVGEEVQAAFGGAHLVGAPSAPVSVAPAQNLPGRRIDLKAIARDRLLAAGVSEVKDLAMCTICDERFFSHRREGARAGRQGAVAWLS